METNTSLKDKIDILGDTLDVHGPDVMVDH